MFHLISGALMAVGALYLCLRRIAPLSLAKWLKGILCLIILFGAFKLQIFRFFFGGSVVQELPYSILILSGWFHASVILMVLLSLLCDASLLLCALWRRVCVRRENSAAQSKGERVRSSGGITLGLAVVALFMATLSVWQAVRVPVVRDVELRFAGLPQDMDGLQVVHLSDLHLSPLFLRPWAEGLVTRVNALNPDLIVLTGDMVDGSPAVRAADVAPLGLLRAKYGVYGSHGNHEYYSNMPAWHEAFTKLGITMLRNEHVVLPIGRSSLVLGGVTDKSGAGRFGMEMPDVEKAFAGSPKGWRLLLSHQPSGAEKSSAQKVALQLSGHTHGGQLFPASLLVGYFNEGYLAGIYTVGDMLLYVSRGAGLWPGFPVRLGAPSEITRLTLRSAQGEGD